MIRNSEYIKFRVFFVVFKVDLEGKKDRCLDVAENSNPSTCFHLKIELNEIDLNKISYMSIYFVCF